MGEKDDFGAVDDIEMAKHNLDAVQVISKDAGMALADKVADDQIAHDNFASLIMLQTCDTHDWDGKAAFVAGLS